jgi:hypothetical protein
VHYNLNFRNGFDVFIVLNHSLVNRCTTNTFMEVYFSTTSARISIASLISVKYPIFEPDTSFSCASACGEVFCAPAFAVLERLCAWRVVCLQNAVKVSAVCKVRQRLRKVSKAGRQMFRQQRQGCVLKPWRERQFRVCAAIAH